MSDTHKLLCRFLSHPEATKLEGILREFWQHNGGLMGDPSYYRGLMRDVTGDMKVLTLAEEAFAHEFTDFDPVFNMWRLKDDPLWPAIKEKVQDVKLTGECPFCHNYMYIVEKRSICRECDKVFHMVQDRRHRPSGEDYLVFGYGEVVYGTKPNPFG